MDYAQGLLKLGKKRQDPSLQQGDLCRRVEEHLPEVQVPHQGCHQVVARTA